MKSTSRQVAFAVAFGMFGRSGWAWCDRRRLVHRYSVGYHDDSGRRQAFGSGASYEEAIADALKEAEYFTTNYGEVVDETPF